MKPTVVAAVFLALHLLPLFWRPNPMWGTDFLFYMTGPWFVFFSLSAVLLFVTGFRRKLQAIVCHFPFALWKGGSRVWVARTAILLVALAALVTMPSARHFLGDGYILIGKLETDTWPNVVRAPFSYTVIRTLHDVGAVLWTSAENTYRTYSTVSGVIYVLLTFPVAAALGKTRLEKSIVLAFLLTAGYLQLFFGYVEHYALYIPFLLLYILLGIRVQEQRLPLHVPATVMGLLLAFHQAFAVFGPSLLYLAYHVYNRRREMVKTWKNVAFPVTALCCVPLTTALLLALSGVDFESYISRMGGRNFLPVFAEPGMAAQYRMFSTSHIVDFLNQQLLVAPAAFMAVFLLRKNALGRQPFLAICAFVPLLFTFLANPEIGAFRDWDVMALPALPLTLWAASALLQGMRHREDLFRGAFMICGAGALHGVLWIGLNANAGTAEDRFVDQLDRLKGGASVNGWLTMGRFHGQQGNRAAAHEAFRRSIEADPTNPNRWLTAGNFSRKTGQYTSAIGYFNKAVELNPDDAMPYMNLGAAYSDMRQFDKAIEFTRKAIALDPDLASAHLNLGAIYRKTAQHDKAIQHLEKASALRPNDGAIHGHLGMAYRSMGQNARAIRHLEKAHALRPDHTSTLVNLAVVCSDAGQNERAIELLERVVTLRPGLVPAYVNLGAVYGRIGQYKTGIRNLKRALELQPDNPETYRNLGLIYKAQIRYPDAIEHFEKALELQTGRGDLQSHLNLGDTYYDMGQHEKAIPHYQTAIQLNPNHANAHLLLGLSYRALKYGDQATAHFEKTLELEPNHPQAALIRRWLEQIRARDFL